MKKEPTRKQQLLWALLLAGGGAMVGSLVKDGIVLPWNAQSTAKAEDQHKEMVVEAKEYFEPAHEHEKDVILIQQDVEDLEESHKHTIEWQEKREERDKRFERTLNRVADKLGVR